MNGTGDAGGPLAGVLVADFSRVLAGPLATMTLGDLGATVIKVENPDGGDDTRTWGPPFASGESTYFLSVNRNKRSVTLDLSTDEGAADARRLAERADVLVENFRPGRLARFGLGYDELATRNPGLVYCSISGFGSGSGPGAALTGYDFVVQAVSGLMDITGPEDGPPSKTGVAIVDVVTGLQATIGILAALRAREATGRGRRVEVDLLSSALSALVNQASGYLNAGVVPDAIGNRHPSVAPYETLRARDGLLALAVGNDRQFRDFCAILGAPDLAGDSRFATNPARVANRAALGTALEALLCDRDVAGWLVVLRDAGIACGRVNDVAQAFAEARALGLDEVVELDGAIGPVRSVANPIKMSCDGPSYRRPPPALGADTDEVRAWLRAGTPLID